MIVPCAAPCTQDLLNAVEEALRKVAKAYPSAEGRKIMTTALEELHWVRSAAEGADGAVDIADDMTSILRLSAKAASAIISSFRSTGEAHPRRHDEPDIDILALRRENSRDGSER